MRYYVWFSQIRSHMSAVDLPSTSGCYEWMHALNFIILTGKSFKSAEETVFTENYARLTNVINIHTLIPYLIQNKVITTDDASDITSCKRDSEKAMKLLEYISHHLQAGYTESFHIMLDIMKTRGTIAEQKLANEMESSLLVKSSKGTVVCVL